MSKLFYRSAMVCRCRLRDRVWNKRLFFTCGVFLVFLYMTEEGLLKFASQNALRITPFVFPFLSGDWICQMIISGYFLWLVSDLCSQRETDMFIRVRAGEKAWRLGNCISITVCAFIYTFALIAVSVILLLPSMDFSVEWGKFWNTLARTGAVMQNHIQIYVAPIVIRMYGPAEALLRAALLQVLCLFWLALLMYLLNDLTGKTAGIYVALAFIFLDVMLANTFQERLYKFSPVTLAQLGNYSVATKQYGLSFGYAVLFYLAGILVFSGLVLLGGRHRKRRQNGK